MCGIAGFVNLDGSPVNVDIPLRMNRLQRHRGPDDQGIRLFSLDRQASSKLDPNAPPPAGNFDGALSFSRLSILDLSRCGHQPMCNADGRVFIAFNGEVYNAFDHVTQLKSYGYQFRSRTDTEVILYLYERYGIEGMLEQLNGMFAIVIVDLNRGEIHLARDHFGVKPLYWARRGQTLLFASEVKSFLAHPAFQCELATDHLDEYLAFRYCAGERHLLKGVFQLRPGHRIRITSGDFAITRYWTIPDPDRKLTISLPEAVNQLGHLLRSSVRSQLLSDVKVGCQLSGGIDSSLVTLIARDHCDADMDAFSVVFDDPHYSEEVWINQAAMKAGVDSHRFLFTEKTFLESLEPATWHLDQPLNHPNSLGIYHLARKSRPWVTVLLSGEGADELFGGYPRFYYAALRPHARSWLPLLHRLPKLGSKLKRVLLPRNYGDVDAFVLASLFQGLDQLVDLRPETRLSESIEHRCELFAEGQSDFLTNCLKYEMQTFMVDLLVRQDKMTMAHSLENRVPYLDRKLVEFVRMLPSPHLVGRGLHAGSIRMRNTKIVLKSLARRTFSNSFVFRPKSGFSLPLAHYFKSRRFRELFHDQLLPGMHKRGLFRASAIAKSWTRLSPTDLLAAELLWIPVSLELWAQQFIDGRGRLSGNIAEVASA